MEEAKLYNLQNYYCPDWANLTLQGNWYSPVYKLLTLKYQRCIGNNCVSEDEFMRWIDGKWIQQIMISSFFDIANYENPINYFLDDSYMAIEFGRTQFSTIYYKRDNLKLDDSLIGFFNEN